MKSGSLRTECNAYRELRDICRPSDSRLGASDLKNRLSSALRSSHHFPFFDDPSSITISVSNGPPKRPPRAPLWTSAPRLLSTTSSRPGKKRCNHASHGTSSIRKMTTACSSPLRPRRHPRKYTAPLYIYPKQLHQHHPPPPSRPNVQPPRRTSNLD